MVDVRSVSPVLTPDFCSRCTGALNVQTTAQGAHDAACVQICLRYYFHRRSTNQSAGKLVVDDADAHEYTLSARAPAQQPVRRPPA